MGLTESAAALLFLGTMVCAVLVLCAVSYFGTRWFFSTAIGYVAGKTPTRWDDILLESRFFARLSHFAPVLVVYFAATGFPEARDWIQRAVLAYMVVVGVFACNALLSAGEAIYRTLEVSRHRPIRGFVQIVKILVFIVGVILFVAALIDRSPWVFLTGVSALTAVLLLVFKDTLLGLVASFQITASDMVREGDWIEMPKYGADGDVIDVTLYTVKVRNWDKTITTIPTYALVSDSFKNWRGMEESGGRRIKRAVNIDMNSIRFCDDALLERFEKIRLISDYVREKREEIERHNAETGADTSVLVNGRRLTNVGTFRAYVAAYLRSHPRVHQGLTFLVRQLAPGETGLPIEIYVFCSDQAWARYEAIQADIFDHILSVVPEFGLRVFQSPSGNDFAGLAGSSAARA
jgi:miniconductance mechanosensitive channel